MAREESEPTVAADVEYGIDDRPPASTSVLLGLQHYLTMVGANIAVPLALAGAMGMPDDVTARFVGTFFVVSGVATLAQTTLGNRYPIVQGAPFSMLAPAIAIVGVVANTPGNPGWETQLVHLQGAIIAAALVEVAIGYLGVVGRIREYLSPVVIAPTIALIGLSLFDAPQIAGATNWWLLGLTVVLIVGFSQYLGEGRRIFRLFPVLLGMVTAWAVAAALSVAGVYTADTSGYVPLGEVADAPAFFLIYPLQWGTPEFQLSLVIGMFAGVLASIVESFGDYHAVARIAGRGAPSAKRIDHGIGMEGLMNVFSGLMGTGGSTSYSENIGAIGLTGVASRYVIQVGAVVMIVFGYVGYFGQLVATIPSPIVGGLFVAMFGQIVAVGIANLEHVDLSSSRNTFVVGFALFAGLAVPAYVDGFATIAAFREGMETVAVVGPVLGSRLVADTVYVIGSTGMAVGGIVALVLDNTIPGSREERGLVTWERIAEDEGDFRTAVERWRDRGGAEDAD
ncbi:uracil-xanthine permease family protein [Halostella litorea]|uniref:uracil-xanthine permease family protein n=1 Tax=Halostella litorea TaxID=2528831 RepID=UPI0010925201|nr:solute carrier family 23 protein [Halostella litorea]